MNTSWRRPLRLALLGPVPPAPSGISDYTAELLPALTARAEVDLFIDDYEPVDPDLKWQLPVRSHEELLWRFAGGAYDAVVYQMGNSAVHRYQWPLARRLPGFLVLHDFVLHHMVAGAALAGRQEHLDAYLEDMAYTGGPDALRVAWDVLTGRRAVPFRGYPLCEPLIDVSLGVLVHSRYLQGEVARINPAVPTGYVPMGVPLPDPLPRAAARCRLGVPQDAFVVGSFGEVTENKRIVEVLAALQRLAISGVAFQYLVVGNDRAYDVRAAAARAGLGSVVRVTGRVDRAQFEQYMAATDVVVNLRHPTAGETSASALRVMAAGLPVIVSDAGANAELPDACCVKLPVGGDEVPLLAALLARLAAEPEFRDALGSNARAFIDSDHTTTGAARAYIDFIAGVLERPRPRPAPFRNAAAIAAAVPGRPAPASPDVQYLQSIARRMSELGIGTLDLSHLGRLATALAAAGVDPRPVTPPDGEEP